MVRGALLITLFLLIASCSMQRGESGVRRQAYPEFLGPDDPDGPKEGLDLESDFNL